MLKYMVWQPNYGAVYWSLSILVNIYLLCYLLCWYGHVLCVLNMFWAIWDSHGVHYLCSQVYFLKIYCVLSIAFYQEKGPNSTTINEQIRKTHLLRTCLNKGNGNFMGIFYGPQIALSMRGKEGLIWGSFIGEKTVRVKGMPTNSAL